MLREEKSKIVKCFVFLKVQFIRREIDFVKANNLAARRLLVMHRSPSVSALDDIKKRLDEEEKNHKRGEVPK